MFVVFLEVICNFFQLPTYLRRYEWECMNEDIKIAISLTMSTRTMKQDRVKRRPIEGITCYD